MEKKISKLLEGGSGVAGRRKRVGWCWVLQGFNKGERSSSGVFGRSLVWKGGIVGKKSDRMTNAFSTRAGHVDAMTAIVIGGSAKVPTVYAMRSPGFALQGSFVE